MLIDIEALRALLVCQFVEIDEAESRGETVDKEDLEELLELSKIIEEMESVQARRPRGVRLRQLEPHLRRSEFAQKLSDQTYQKLYRINYDQLVELTQLAKPFLPKSERPGGRKYSDEELVFVTVQFIFQGMTWNQMELAFDVSASVAHDMFPDYAYALIKVVVEPVLNLG